MLYYNFSTVSFGYPTILERVFAYPILLLLAVFLIGFGAYLIKESHAAVFGKTGKPRFHDAGVYSLIRHPMYLGGLMILLGFLFLKFSLIGFAICIICCGLCNWMATYEEKDLVRVLGKEYADYQSKVPKWLPFSKGR